MVKIYKFILFVYLNYIKEDWATWTKFGQIVIYPFWWVRSFCIWMICFIFLPLYWYEGSSLQKSVERMKKELELANSKTIIKFIK